MKKAVLWLIKYKYYPLALALTILVLIGVLTALIVQTRNYSKKQSPATANQSSVDEFKDLEPTQSPTPSASETTTPTPIASTTVSPTNATQPTTRTPTASPRPVVTTVVPTASPKPTVTSTSSKVAWNGSTWNLTGANMPWYSWGCDFGCANNGGVAGNKNSIGTGIAKASSAGTHVVRWWVFEGDAWQITRDGSGMPTGIKSEVYTDFDAALQLAQQYNIYYSFVLFSSPTSIPRSWLENTQQRAKLASVLGTLFARYKDNSRILTWEVFNEPEWDIWNNKIPQNIVVDSTKSIVQSIHANSHAYATVGHAMLDGMPMWANVGLDFYSPHWYDYMNSGDWCASCRTYDDIKKQWGITKPIVLGEVYLGSDVNAAQRLNDLYQKGYAGVWGWSLFPDKTSDKMQIDFAGLKTFSSQHGEVGPK